MDEDRKLAKQRDTDMEHGEKEGKKKNKVRSKGRGLR